MSEAICQALRTYESTALPRAKRWMDNCNYTTSKGWLAYSKLIMALLDYSQYHYEEHHIGDTAWYIKRYYERALDRLNTIGSEPSSLTDAPDVLLHLHLSIKRWKTLPGSLWLQLQKEQWNPTPLYKWSLDNENLQERALATKQESTYDLGVLHLCLASTLLVQCFRELPILVDTAVHWQLWETFGCEGHYRSQDRLRKLELLCQATPASFEHAITECYQQHDVYFNAEECAPLLKMGLDKGHTLTTCHGLLLLYFRFYGTHPSLFQTIERRYPLLLAGLRVHFSVYPELAEAVFNASGLMSHWMHAVHGMDNTMELALPADVIDA